MSIKRMQSDKVPLPSDLNWQLWALMRLWRMKFEDPLFRLDFGCWYFLD